MDSLIAASAKFLTGAWLPVLLTMVLIVLMQTWRQGMKALKQQHVSGERASFKDLFQRCDNTPRIPGTSGVLLSGQSFKPELLEYLDRFQALPEHTILVWIMYVDDARVLEEDRYALKLETKGLHTLTIKTGFSERPDIIAALIWANVQGCLVDSEKTTFFVFRRTLVVHKTSEPPPTEDLAYWRRLLFCFLFRNASPIWKALSLPDERVVEIGVREFI